jgi:hypothetical protein
MTQWMKRLCLVVSAAAIFAAAPANAGPTQDIVKHVPKDAWGYVVVRSIGTLDKNIAQLQNLGLPIPPGVQLGGMLQGPPLNLGDNIDLEQPLCIVMLDANKFGTAENSPMDPWRAAAAIIPSKNPKALVDQLAVGDADGGVRKIKVMDEEVYAAVKGNVLIVGKSEKTVKAVSSETGDGAAMGSARSDLLDITDIYVNFSMDRVYGAYNTMIAPMLQMVTMQADPTGKTGKQLEKMLQELESIGIGFRMDDSGIALRGLVSAKKDSDLELLLKDTKNSESSRLALLPKEQYLFAMGAASYFSDHAAKFGDPNTMASLVNAFQLSNVDKSAVSAMDTEILKMNKAVKSAAASVSMLTGEGQGFLGFAAVIEVDNPTTYIESLRKMYKTIWRISDAEELKTAKDLLTHTPDAEEIEGSKVDTITLKCKELVEQMEAAPDDVKAFKAFFGEDVTVRFGAIDGKYVLMTFGGGKDRYKEAAKMAKAGSDGLAMDTGIKGTAKHLASPRSTEMFVSVENILRLVKAASKEIDGEDAIPFEIPKIDAPAGFDVAGVDGGSRFDMFIPLKLVDAVKKAVDEQAARDMEAFDEVDDDSMGGAAEDSDDAETPDDE